MVVSVDETVKAALPMARRKRGRDEEGDDDRDEMMKRKELCSQQKGLMNIGY